ncbi:hypothetical protein BU23DRAFT_194369 [Bimuria novae-zelandiae CBS 107.79]|uniref:Uncharacterized protein n=1 Tax=Bimuria novae-zelandiae CBS 107.79 TaxID=1447943 RepID=A0A6A5V1I2_9PLEO|nr:hypothetical protein BU23DRAFT_194369 [Bimuria novae-zelandiae CBS 107.79]
MGTCNPPFSHLPIEIRFVYEKLPKAKPASRRIPLKDVPNHDNKTLGITSIPRCDPIEATGLAYLDDGASDGPINNGGDREDGNDWNSPADHDNDWTLSCREKSLNYEQDGYARDILSVTDESLHGGSPAERSSQEIETGIDGHQMHLIADNGEKGRCHPERADASPQNTMGYPAPTLMEPEVIDLTDRGKHNSSIRQKRNGINADITGVGDETSDNDGREGESECCSQGADSNAQNAMGI